MVPRGVWINSPWDFPIGSWRHGKFPRNQCFPISEFSPFFNLRTICLKNFPHPISIQFNFLQFPSHVPIFLSFSHEIHVTIPTEPALPSASQPHLHADGDHRLWQLGALLPAPLRQQDGHQDAHYTSVNGTAGPYGRPCHGGANW